jgi:hypothetical protein
MLCPNNKSHPKLLGSFEDEIRGCKDMISSLYIYLIYSEYILQMRKLLSCQNNICEVICTTRPHTQFYREIIILFFILYRPKPIDSSHALYSLINQKEILILKSGYFTLNLCPFHLNGSMSSCESSCFMYSYIKWNFTIFEGSQPFKYYRFTMLGRTKG